VIDPTRVYRPKEIVALTGCPRAMVYEALHSDHLPHIKRGGRFYIPGGAAERWVESLGDSKATP
jgi:excisionase family DNA binding protein